jgi:PAS domain-containing protein
MFRWQVVGLLLGAAAPWIGYALYTFRRVFAERSGGWLESLRFRLLDLVPVTHSMIVAGMCDGIIVLDVQCRVVDLNPAAEDILGWPILAALGQPVEQLLLSQPELIERCRAATEARLEIRLREAEAPRSYEAQIARLLDRRARSAGGC